MKELTFAKKYGDRTVIDVADLKLEDEKKYALIGANGSGKSTMLKILGNLVRPDKGAVIDLRQSTLCYMPQQSLGFSMSVKRNVKLACPDLPRFDFKTRVYYNDRCYRILDEMGLWKLRFSNGAALSGGETQRMALARALMMKHDLLLLDEPTASMDVTAAGIAENVINKYCDEFHPTLVFATHSFKQAERLADEVLFLHEGKLIERGTPDQIFYNPQCELTKTFLKFGN